MVIVFVGPFLGFDFPLTLIQLLWVNLGTCVCVCVCVCVCIPLTPIQLLNIHIHTHTLSHTHTVMDTLAALAFGGEPTMMHYMTEPPLR
jgi:hypothetical protein